MDELFVHTAKQLLSSFNDMLKTNFKVVKPVWKISLKSKNKLNPDNFHTIWKRDARDIPSVFKDLYNWKACQQVNFKIFLIH